MALPDGVRLARKDDKGIDIHRGLWRDLEVMRSSVWLREAVGIHEPEDSASYIDRLYSAKAARRSEKKGVNQIRVRKEGIGSPIHAIPLKFGNSQILSGNGMLSENSINDKVREESDTGSSRMGKELTQR